MRQKFTLLTKTLLLLCALVAGSGSVWAEDVTGTINFGSADGSTKIQGSSSSGSGTVTYTDTGNDSQGNTWTITTVTSKNKSFTQNASYSQVGASSNPVTSITFTTTLPSSQTIKAFSAKFGGFSGTAGTVTLKVGDTSVGTGSLNASNDVTVSATNTTTSGTVLTVTVTGISKGVKAYYISYTYATSGGTPTVVTPTFEPTEGTYTAAQSVTLSCETDGATIHYTMTEDGTTPDDPTESDVTYSAAISVTKSGTKIKAKAFKSDMTASSVASATYTIKPNAPTITGGANVTITGDNGLTFYYTTDNSAPTNASTEYTGAFTPGDCTVKAIAYDVYGNASAVTTLKYKYMPLSPKNINSGYYEKVSDASTLDNGDAVLIVNENGKAAMSTTQNTANRAKEDIEFIISGVIYAPSAKVQKLVLVKKSEKIGDANTYTDVFYFYTGEDGYLYASSSSNNQLKTEQAPDDNNNARATISISNGGDATITFTGNNSRNLLKYNSTNNPPIFSCYGSGQTAVQIYKEVAHNESATITSAEYATFNSPYALDFTGKATVYTATDCETSVTLNEITSGKVPANTPVVLYKAGADGSAINVPIIASADAPAGTNDLHVVGEGGLTGEDNIYVLAKNPTVGFYLWDKTATLNAGKIYLQGKASYGGSRAFLGFGEATAVESVHVTAAVNGEYYNLAGQKVAQPTKGLYIVNGRKVVMK